MIQLIHKKQTPKRAYFLLLLTTSILLIIPKQLTNTTAAFRPVSKQQLIRVIQKNHPQPTLVKAIIQVESRWNQKALSSKGALGLMQVMPSSAKHFGFSKEDLRCPVKNIQAGIAILKYYQRTSPTLKVALAKYSGNTQGYYKKVMEAM